MSTRSKNSKEHDMRKHRGAILIVLSVSVVLALATVAVLAQGNSLAIRRWVIAGGGGSAGSDGVSIRDTVGQPVIGRSAEGDISLSAGYWAGSVSGATYTYYFPIVMRDSR